MCLRGQTVLIQNGVHSMQLQCALLVLFAKNAARLLLLKRVNDEKRGEKYILQTLLTYFTFKLYILLVHAFPGNHICVENLET